MGVYTYSQSKLIDEITFVKSEGGQTRAYLHAAANADPKTLYNVSCKLAAEGWQVTPYNMGAKPVLEVLGFGKEGKLLALAKSNGWVEGEGQHKKDVKDKLNLKEQVKKRSLAASGAFYLVGDAAFTRYGYGSKDWRNTAAGVMYGAGTLSLLGFGRKDQSDLQVQDIAKKLDAYLKENGNKLPESCSLESITQDHKRGLIRSADDLFRRYPSEMMNVFFAVAGTLIAIAARDHMRKGMHTEEMQKSFADVLQRKQTENPGIDPEYVRKKFEKFHKLEGKLDIGLGSMTSAAGLFTLAVKEKAPDPDAPPKHGMGALWEKIQQRPLTIAGGMLMASTLCHAVSTGLAWNWSDSERRNTVGWRAAFVAANIIAELLLAISSKGHGSGVKADHSVDSTIISLASELIAKQPVNMHEPMIDHVARFLGRRDVLASKDEEVRRQLHEQVAFMRKNPWAMHGKVVEPTATTEKDESWKARVAQQGTPPQPQLSS